MDWNALSGVSDLGSLITGIAGVITNGVQAKKQRESNEQMIRETNASNLEQVDKQNAAAAAEAEKQRAYESAPAQVSRLRSAGMSKAGALGTLNGAGGYTPAPVNAGQSQAPTQEYQQIDFSGVANALQGMAQLSMQEKALKQSAQQFDDNLNRQKRIDDAEIANKNAQTGAIALENATKEYQNTLNEISLTEKSEVKKYAPIIEDIALDADFKTTDELKRIIRDKNKDAFVAISRYSELSNLVSAKVQMRNAERIGNADAYVSEHTKSSRVAEVTARVNNILADTNLKQEQKHNIEQATQEITNRLGEYSSPAANDARFYERQLRKIAAEMNYDIALRDFEIFKKHSGDHRISAEARGFWRFLSDVLGIETVSKIIGMVLVK